jgi:hypothetical protein
MKAFLDAALEEAEHGLAEGDPSGLDRGPDRGRDLRRQRAAAVERDRWNADQGGAPHFKMVLEASRNTMAE